MFPTSRPNIKATELVSLTFTFELLAPLMLLMDSPQHKNDDGLATVMATKETFRLRDYQAEMVEESMKANIIVVMDTGSGKTLM